MNNTYYRRFVRNFPGVAASLHELTKKLYQWGESKEKAFQTIKDLLCAAPVLAYTVKGEKFILESDTSGYDIGGVLFQVVNGTEKVVGHYSRTCQSLNGTTV